MAAIKPTVLEYDTVYQGLRQSAVENYQLLRTWILEGGNGPGAVVQISFNDLTILLAGFGAVPGQVYEITDFRSVQEIPNTAVTNIYSLEPLLVTAATTSELAAVAVSTTNPEDIIYYDITNTDFGATLGRIMYRKNVALNLEAWFDFTTFLYRRWETAPASGIFTVLTDNGNAFQDAPAFVSVGLLSCTNISIPPLLAAPGAQTQNNIVIGGQSQEIVFGPDCFDITMGTSCQAIKMGQSCSIITMGNGCTGHSFGMFNTNIVFPNFTVGVFMRDFNDQIVFQSIGFLTGQAVLGVGNTDITYGERCSFITIGNGNQTVQFGDQCQELNIGNNNADIVYGGGCSACTMYNNVSSRSVSGLASHRQDWRGKTTFNIVWDFATQGGGVGTHTIGSINVDAQAIYTLIRVLSPLVGGGGSTLAAGFAVDDFEAFQTLQSIGAPVYDGTTRNAANEYDDDTTFSVVTTVNQDLILTVGGGAITAGRILIKSDVIYTDF